MSQDTYVLVQGAWTGKFCWAEVAPQLEAAGHTALTLDLPRHGGDSTPLEIVTLERYCEAVLELMGDRTNVVLVGHSMAGMIISAVAEAIPTQLKALVFICARSQPPLP